MEIENLLEVRIGEEIFGFDADSVEQILRIPEITSVPLASSEMIGVSVLSGKIVNIVDIGKRLSSKSVTIESEEARILTFKNSLSALCVDEVLSMVVIDKECYEEVDAEDGLCAFYKESDKIVQVIEPSKIFNSLQIEEYKPKEILDTPKESSYDKNTLVEVEHKRFLFFYIKSESYAIDIELLQELIFVPKEITPIAGSDALGMIRLREDVITLLDTNKLLGFNSSEIDNKSRVLVLKYRGKNIALLVDNVDEIKGVALSNIEQIPQNFKNKKIEAIYKDNSEVSSILSQEFLIGLTKEYAINEDFDRSDSEEEIKEGIMSEVAVFKVDSEEYAFDIEEVQEIIAYDEITPVPEAPEFVEGILNLRGAVIPIVSLPKRLGYSSNITHKTKIIVCLLGDEKIGFIVDDVNEILFLEDKYISKSKNSDSIFDEIITLENGDRVILKIKTENLVDKDEISSFELSGA